MTVKSGEGSTRSLAAMPYNILTKKVVAAKFFVTPERLSPTDSASKFHCRRMYCQVMVWKGMECDLGPLDWGWGLAGNRFVQIRGAVNAAPDTILKVIHCNRTTACGTPVAATEKWAAMYVCMCVACQRRVVIIHQIKPLRN